MATLNMVLGTVETGDLGFTLSHEHVMSSSAGVRQTYPEFLDRAGAIEKAVKDLKEAYSEGLRTLIDMTTLDLGRDIRLLEEVSRRTGINIMAATGTWQDIPRVFWNAHPDRVAALYVREIEEGIEETGIKARRARAKASVRFVLNQKPGLESAIKEWMKIHKKLQ